MMLAKLGTLFIALCSPFFLNAEATVNSFQSVNAPITAMAITPDGKALLVGSQIGIAVRSLPDLHQLGKVESETSTVHDLAFSHNYKYLAIAGGRPGECGIVEIRKWPSGELVQRCKPHRDVVFSLAWNQSDDQIATASSDSTLQIIEIATGKSVISIDGHSRPVTAVAWLENNHGIVSAGVDESVRLWNAKTGAPLRNLNNHTRPVLSLAKCKPMENVPLIASIGADRTVRIWQPTVGRLVRFAKLTSEPRAVAWTPEGKSIVTACVDGRVRVIDPKTAEVNAELSGIPGVAHSLVVTSDGLAIVGGEGGTIKVVRLP